VIGKHKHSDGEHYHFVWGPGRRRRDLHQRGGKECVQGSLYDKFATHSEGDAGLSLYISRKIVEAHGGSLSGKNNEDGGATFAFKLPTDLEPTVYSMREQRILANDTKKHSAQCHLNVCLKSNSPS
jgi:Histidine kinase-, DNA gyrase B-, and HSP90-like ATPase